MPCQCHVTFERDAAATCRSVVTWYVYSAWIGWVGSRRPLRSISGSGEYRGRGDANALVRADQRQKPDITKDITFLFRFVFFTRCTCAVWFEIVCAEVRYSAKLVPSVRWIPLRRESFSGGRQEVSATAPFVRCHSAAWVSRISDAARTSSSAGTKGFWAGSWKLLRC